MDSTKYDRQIRLFGEETQRKLCSLKVQILGTSNAVAMEIIKNVVLLGVETIAIEESMLEETKKYIPNSLQEINENLKIQFKDKIIESDFLFLIDQSYSGELKNYYFICSKCFTIKFSESEHVCKDIENDSILAKQCLIGAFAVQEFLKLIQGKRNCNEFNLRD